MALSIHLQRQVHAKALALERDEAIEDRLPILVAGEVVVGDEEALDVLGGVSRTMRSMSSGVRKRDLRPCTLMMVQKLQAKGQPRPASKLVRSPKVRCTYSRGM